MKQLTTSNEFETRKRKSMDIVSINESSIQEDISGVKYPRKRKQKGLLIKIFVYNFINDFFNMIFI